jgi:hypothetical protein
MVHVIAAASDCAEPPVLPAHEPAPDIRGMLGQIDGSSTGVGTGGPPAAPTPTSTGTGCLPQCSASCRYAVQVGPKSGVSFAHVGVTDSAQRKNSTAAGHLSGPPKSAQDCVHSERFWLLEQPTWISFAQVDEQESLI